MGKPKDYTGKRIGKLVAIEATNERRRGSVIWLMQCDCGNTCRVSTKHMSGKFAIKSCGCIRTGIGMKDHAGSRFGRLVAIEPTDRRQAGFVIWKCLCDCGNISYVNSRNLVSGGTKSCGCLGREISSEMMKAKIGPLNYLWNPEKTDAERKDDRKYKEYDEWRNAVYLRDCFTCQKCGDSTGGNLIAHHIEGYTDNLELRTEASNGITLCEKCHKNFHHTYGYNHSTRKKFDEWFNQ